jgi:ribonucleoside-diphosphate reductase alpha chain
MKLSSSLPDMTKTDEEKKIIQKILGDKFNTNLAFPPNALTVVAKRYLRKTLRGEILENPEQMYERVANTLAKVEKQYGADDKQIEEFTKQFFEVMSEFKFTPAGRTLTNAGAKTRLIANCIVLHIEDSMDHIFQTLADAALLQQSGSGLGFPLHLLRPAGEKTVTSFGEASGPVSFLHVYNTSFGVIKQQNRHGANMAVMSVEHPDILEFIHCKDVEGDLKNFNVSVGLTDRFMKAVKENDPKPWITEFKGKKYNVRDIKRDKNFNLLSVTPTKMTARQLFMEIVNSAWKTGEPGCVFLDTVNQVNPLPGLGRIEACNPCGL